MKNKNLKKLIQRSNEGSGLEVDQTGAFEILNPEMDYSIRGGDLIIRCSTKSGSCGVNTTCGTNSSCTINKMQ